jgi:hypothetical protein
MLKALLLFTIIAVPIELMSFVAGKLLVGAHLMYDPAPVENYQEYLQDRDPIVGWPGKKSLGHGEYDTSGSRISPRFPDPATPSCAAVFGDSFTWGSEVEPANAYPNVLSDLLGCRVANYGVGGYGTDQSYLRYLELIKDRPPIVILGHFSENIIRNVNQERGLIANQTLGLKPRFTVAEGKLERIPIPTLTEDQYRTLSTRAHEILPHEYFTPGGASGFRTLRFPYTLAAFGTFMHYRVQARLRGRPSYADFYDPDHAAGGLQVTEAIIEAFVSEATGRQQKAMVLLIPDEKDLLWLREHGTTPYRELTTRLKAHGVNVIDAADELNRRLGNEAPCTLYTRCGGNSHFRPEGYRALAEIVYAKLEELHWVPPDARATPSQ